MPPVHVQDPQSPRPAPSSSMTGASSAPTGSAVNNFLGSPSFTPPEARDSASAASGGSISPAAPEGGVYSPWESDKTAIAAALYGLEEILEDDGDHPLLTDEPTVYSQSVRQRAFITWAHLGAKISLCDTLKHYHYLEELESTYTPDQRAASRQLEYSTINGPPSTPYFQQNWGHIYEGTATNVVEKLRHLWDTPKEGSIVNGVTGHLRGGVWGAGKRM